MAYRFPVQVYYEDTDATGVVYHTNYIKYMERARSTLLQQKGLSLPAIIDKFGIQFLVRGIKVDFRQPARLLQSLTVVTRMTKIGRASLVFQHDLYFEPGHEQTMICSGEVVLVCANMAFKPCAIPADVLKEIKIEN